MKKHRWQNPGDHPDQNLILMFLEGELDEGDSSDVAHHLRTCWDCRAYSEQIERGICAFVEYRKESLLPELPPPTRGWRNFTFRLQRAIKAFEAHPAAGPSTQSRLAWLQRGAARRRKSLPLGSSAWQVVLRVLRPVAIGVPRPAWISGAISIVTVFAVLHFSVVQPPPMQAAEFLRRAAAAIPAPQRPRTVLYQKVRVRRGSVVFDQVLAHGAKVAASISPDIPTRNAMSLVKMDWKAPLSAERFSDWRKTVPQKDDRIFESPSSLTLRTTPLDSQGDEVRYASLTVNRADWRPIAEHVEFRRQPALDVTEVSFEVRELPSVTQAAPSINASALEPALTEPLVKSTETELAVRYALHGVGADLGEPIEIQTGGQGSVSVFGTVSSTERKRELLGALRGIPNVVPQLRTEEEAAPPELPAPVTRAEPLIVTVRSPIERELLEYFSDPAAVETFSKRAIAVTGDLMARAWALRHLSDRYGAAGSHDELALSPALSPTSRQMLETMRRDHYRAMSDATSELTALLQPVLHSIIQATPEPTTKLPLFDSAQEVQRLTLEILSGSGSPDANQSSEPAKAAQDLLVALRGLEATLEEQP
jgi:anti-sigma factor RsiW